MPEGQLNDKDAKTFLVVGANGHANEAIMALFGCGKSSLAVVPIRPLAEVLLDKSVGADPISDEAWQLVENEIADLFNKHKPRHIFGKRNFFRKYDR